MTAQSLLDAPAPLTAPLSPSLARQAKSASAEFYDKNALAYFDSTVHVDMSGTRGRFLWHMPPGARVLDAGCGSGRDALAFSRAGCRVDAFDASLELARLACAHTGLAVQTKTFSQLDDCAQFDGVWACASLVHLEPAALQDAIQRLSAALKPNGWLYTSFKVGAAPYIDDKGRCFNRQTVTGAKALLAAAGLSKIDTWVTPHLAEPGVQWVNLLARKHSEAA